MATREEIREGVIKNLNEFRWELQKPNALINADTLVVLQGAFADKIMADESNQGVVRKVDGELPKSIMDGVNGNDKFGKRELARLLENWAGYVAVEPLIEVGLNATL